MTRARILIAGVSTRAFAESAARAGYDVTAIDGFADLDLRACAGDVIRVRDAEGRFRMEGVTRAARDVAARAVAYVASFENHPRAVAALARSRTLLGNPPAVLERVRNPLLLARALTQRGHAVPAVRLSRAARANGERWLVKPRASGGGHDITEWRPRAPARVPEGAYLQQLIRGVPGSVVFAADGERAIILGVSRLLVGERAFGARAFRYCGNILSAPDDPQFANGATLFARAAELGAATAEAFRLVGVSGVDFVARAGQPYAVEVNPRYTAAMELVERAYSVSIFDVHARACGGRLPVFELDRVRAATSGAFGKAVVYARRETTIGDTRDWLADDSVRDIPAPGERIPRGHPICTVFAREGNAASCHRALVARAARVFAAVAAPARSIA